ncbi:hypothetical protein JTL63_35360, partial [Pseudomonas aeruginosa]|nr:hypothetical protein [Pseudomonas aeruginosa]
MKRAHGYQVVSALRDLPRDRSAPRSSGARAPGLGFVVVYVTVFSSLKRFSFARKVLIIRKLTIVLLGSDHEPSSYTLVPGKGIEGVERSL